MTYGNALHDARLMTSTGRTLTLSTLIGMTQRFPRAYTSMFASTSTITWITLCCNSECCIMSMSSTRDPRHHHKGLATASVPEFGESRSLCQDAGERSSAIKVAFLDRTVSHNLNACCGKVNQSRCISGILLGRHFPNALYSSLSHSIDW